MPKSTKSRRAQTARTASLPEPAGTFADMTTYEDQDAEHSADLVMDATRVDQNGSSVVTPAATVADLVGVDGPDDSDLLEIVVRIGMTCACGCQADVASKRMFLQGHDQRLIGILARAAGNKHDIQHGVFVESPLQYGQRVLSDAGAIKLAAAIDRAVSAIEPQAKRRTQVPSTEVNRANLISVPDSQVQTGDEIKVRIGRHEYFARVHGMNQAGKVTAVAYRTKAKPDDEKITEKFTIVD